MHSILTALRGSQLNVAFCWYLLFQVSFPQIKLLENSDLLYALGLWMPIVSGALPHTRGTQNKEGAEGIN